MGLSTLFVVITSGWVGDGIKGDCLFKEWFDLYFHYNVCSGITRIESTSFSLVLFILSALYAFWAGREILAVRHLTRGDEVTPHKVLIIALTAWSPEPKDDGSTISISNGKNTVSLSGNINHDINAFNDWDRPPNFQQTLRAIKPHLGKLERGFLIGSKGDRGSAKFLEIAEKIFKLYAKDITITHHGDVDFEDIEHMTQLFERLVSKAENDKYQESDIILDVTGGQKTASIAAAMCTLKRKGVEFQYVQTGENPRAISFNMLAEATDKLSA
jgi:hypothetical protein